MVCVITAKSLFYRFSIFLSNNMEAYQSIGFTKKTYGVKGELKLNIEDRYLEDFAQADVLFLDIAGRKIPYFLEYINFENPFTLKFEDFDSKESAIELTGKEIFMRTTDLLAEEERVFEVVGNLVFEQYINFEIVDKTLGEIGIIEEIIEYPQQEMAALRFQEKEVLIPMNEQLITKIDTENKVIEMDLPEGLLSLE